MYLLVYGRHSKKWGFPKGRCEYDESTAQTAMRELREETGIRLSRLDINTYIRFNDNMYYVVEIDDIDSYPTRIEDRDEIEEVRWFTTDEMLRLTHEQGNYGLNQFKSKIIDRSQDNA
jgi:8-oxo-dGTP pyrophosphatase MutT (NUDIX family)